MEELFSQLEQTTCLIDEMQALSQQKRETIVGGNAQKMEEILREETGLLARMKKQEEKRQRAAMLLANQLGVRPMGITITALAQAAEGEQAQNLLHWRDTMTEKMETLSRLNDINRLLLQTQVDVLRYSLESTTRPTQLGVQYSGTGADMDSVDPISLFDAQA